MRWVAVAVGLLIGCGGPPSSLLSRPLASAPTDDGLVVEARPLLGLSTKDDPVSIAMRFRTTNGPIDLRFDHTGRVVHWRETLDTVVVSIATPTGKRVELRPDTVDMARRSTQPLTLRRGSMILWTLTDADARIRTSLSDQQVEYTVAWQKLSEKLFQAAGRYQITIEGALVLGDRPDQDVVQKRDKARLRFKTRALPLLRRSSGKTLVSLDVLHSMAIAAANRSGLPAGARPELSPLMQHRTVDRADGQRQVRLFAPAASGAHVYSMRLDPAGNVVESSRRHQPPAADPPLPWALLMRSGRAE